MKRPYEIDGMIASRGRQPPNPPPAPTAQAEPPQMARQTAHCCACIGCYDPRDGDPHHPDGIELCPKHKQRNPPPKPPSPIERRWGYRVSPMERFPGWYIQINDGPSVYGPYPSGLFSCWGSRDRAVRKAQRIIARQQAKQARSEALTVTSEEA